MSLPDVVSEKGNGLKVVGARQCLCPEWTIPEKI